MGFNNRAALEFEHVSGAEMMRVGVVETPGFGYLAACTRGAVKSSISRTFPKPPLWTVAAAGDTVSDWPRARQGPDPSV
jgi:hypothetical protein